MRVEQGRFSNWGNYPVRTGTSISPESVVDVQAVVAEGAALTPRGNGRSYGDASLGGRMLDGRSLPEVFTLNAE